MLDGKLFRKIRMDKHITQNELAEGITVQSTISKIEADGFEPKREILTKLADALDINVSQLLRIPDNINLKQILFSADDAIKNFDYEKVQSIIKSINGSKIDDSVDRMHYLFLKTESDMWINKNFDDAIFGFNEMLRVEAIKKTIYYPLAYMELAVAYDKKGEFTKASSYSDMVPTLLKKLSTNEKEDDCYWYMLILDNLAQYYNKHEQFQKSKNVVDDMLSFSHEHSMAFDLEMAYYILSDNQAELNGWSKEAQQSLMLAWAFAKAANNSTIEQLAQKRLLLHSVVSDDFF